MKKSKSGRIVRAGEEHRLSHDEVHVLAEATALDELMLRASRLRDLGHGDLVTYSRKVFIPLTKLCRDVCHYCTFAEPPRKGARAYLTPEDVLGIAEQGQAAGCHEALFTLGDKPELRYSRAAEELKSYGAESTLDYLGQMARLVHEQTGLLPHLNPGLMTVDDLSRLRAVSVSQGIMLETSSARLSARGGPHFGSPDKLPERRIATIAAAGASSVPFTTGILIGIGETRRERVAALLTLRDLHDRFGHIQEIIVQNFRAKPNTRMAMSAEPTLDDHLWTIAIARIVFGPRMTIQAPPNLQADGLEKLVAAGINDWGGVSPVTPDHVNPEAPWPHLDDLAAKTLGAGKILAARLPIYPDFVSDMPRWIAKGLRKSVNDLSDARGLARTDQWVAGVSSALPTVAGSANQRKAPASYSGAGQVARQIDRALSGQPLHEADVVRLFEADGSAFTDIVSAADALRASVCGDDVTYVVNRNINYTNVCYFRCQFCAFSKGKMSENLRGTPYVLHLDEIERRAREAWQRGASEVCLQGGIHPAYTGDTYLEICSRIKKAVPDIHVHAFSPLEVWQGAATKGVSVDDFLWALKDAGLGSLPGTAAEILDDDVRSVICPDKINTAQWLSVMGAAHRIGLPTTATIMFGHVDRTVHWARHLLRVRSLQRETRGFTEFVPLPFVPRETPIYLKSNARPGPTYREAVLMHAVARIVLHPVFRNIQTSWVKMGRNGAATCLGAGANDIGGTLMNETITRAAGSTHGQEFAAAEIETLVERIARSPRQRTTLYGEPDVTQRNQSLSAPPLAAVVNTPAKEFVRSAAE
ncbi:MAG: 5-amino-6-(D-ribitylamino)uracil--L-tyrosine 4-hydroxyphenyl transferase CofH [Hyphomicrobiaceae bacterium]